MPVATQQKPLEIDPTQEYLSAGILSEFFGFPIAGATGNSTLFPTNDPILLKHGFDTYEGMMLDPKVSKCVNVLKIGATSDEVELLPSVAASHKDYATALEVQQFCSEALSNMDKPLRQTLEEMLDAIIYGYKIAEVVYELKKLGSFKGQKLIPKYIKVKPFSTAKFVVDKHYNVLAIAGIVSQTSLKPDASEIGYIPISRLGLKDDEGELYVSTKAGKMKIFNREKFMVLTFRSKNCDPRGTSFLKPAFGPYYLKQQIYPEYLRYLLICAIPLLVGFTPENDSIASDILKDDEGNPVTDSNGRFVRFNPVAALRGALLEARNATALALKGGSEIKEIGNQGNNGLSFYKALEVFNEEIESAILLNTLATSEGRFSSRAQSQTHMTVLDQLIWDIKSTLAEMIKSDLLKTIIKYNFGESFLKYMPKVSLGDTERRNFANDSAAVANLFKAGFFTEGQLPHLDKLLGMPGRETGEERVSTVPLVGNPRNDISPNPISDYGKG